MTNFSYTIMAFIISHNTDMELSETNTAKAETSKISRALKRQAPDDGFRDLTSDSDDPGSNLCTARYYIMEPIDASVKLTTVSPFAISKFFKAKVGTVNVKPLRSGCLLIDTDCSRYAKLLLDITEMLETAVKVSPHRSMNSSRGVIRCRELAHVSEEVIKKELKSQGVTEARKTFFTKNGLKEPGNTIILTFGSPTAPKLIKIGYLQVKVDTYLPSPLRCFKCQRYGHSQGRCQRSAVCSKCGEAQHAEGTECPNAPYCVNCQGAHAAISKDCPMWSKEKEILKVKEQMHVSFPEARKLVEASRSRTTYANVATPAPKQVTEAATQTEITWPNTSTNFITLPAQPTLKELAPKMRTGVTQTEHNVENSAGVTTAGSSTSNSQQNVPPKVRTGHVQQTKGATGGTSTGFIQQAKGTTGAISKPPVGPPEGATGGASKPPASPPKGKNKVTTGRAQKGSNDPVKQSNKFSPLEVMDTSETLADQSKGGGKAHSVHS